MDGEFEEYLRFKLQKQIPLVTENDSIGRRAEHTWANKQGLIKLETMTSPLAEIERELEKHQSQLTILMARLDSKDREVEELKSDSKLKDKEMSQLKLKLDDSAGSASRYQGIRSRAWEVYHRDILHDQSFSYTTIQQGDRYAHYGDCVADSLMFQEKKRADGKEFERVYGLSFEDIWIFASASQILANFTPCWTITLRSCSMTRRFRPKPSKSGTISYQGAKKLCQSRQC